MSPFEAAMIVCFGVSWPVAIWKTLKTRQVHGKSVAFLALVASGYGFGILHKALHAFDWVILLYAFNCLMVLTELGLCLMYGARPMGKHAGAEATADTLFCEVGDIDARPPPSIDTPSRMRDGAPAGNSGREWFGPPAGIQLPPNQFLPESTTTVPNLSHPSTANSRRPIHA